MFYCPVCGKSYKEFPCKLHAISIVEKSGEFKCRNCGTTIIITDRSSFEQTGIIEIIYR